MIGDLSLRYVLSAPSGASEDAEVPLVVCMHGRGADARDLADLAPAIDDGYRWVFPNAPRPFEMYPGMTYGWTWFDGLPPTPESVEASRRLLLQFLSEILERYPTPDRKVILAGFSQGGVMSLDAGFRTAASLAGIVVMSGALFEQGMPSSDELADVPPILILHGLHDEMIPVTAARRARQVLEGRNLEVEYHEFAMGHHVIPESLAVVGGFLRRRLQ
ncbi:MAG TPA: dienelactone hydrolase family protein [Thermoanaerobaculia bacterium]|nr:dienelactone hydrolase family protein [Thermoanaerobaculia bacterium]